MSDLHFKKYGLRRTGEVSWAVVGPDHCGTENHVLGGCVRVRYDATLECEHSLDAHGFLIDNMEVDRFMQEFSQAQTGLSCELLVERTCEKLIEHIHRTVPTCRVSELTLMLSPEPYFARVTAVYVR